MAVHTMDRRIVAERQLVWGATEWGVFIMRVVLGLIFVMHGAQKMFGLFGGHPFNESAQFMTTSFGIPLPLAYLSIVAELVGGIMLILGIFARFAALAIFVDMVVAVALVHFKNGFFMSGGPGLGYEYNIALLALCLGVIMCGPGALAFGDWERHVVVGYPEDAVETVETTPVVATEPVVVASSAKTHRTRRPSSTAKSTKRRSKPQS